LLDSGSHLDPDLGIFEGFFNIAIWGIFIQIGSSNLWSTSGISNGTVLSVSRKSESVN